LKKQRLTTIHETKKYARISGTFPDCNLEPDSKLIRSIFNCKEYLTLELYERMLLDLIPYEDVEQYSHSENYVVGSLVLYNGIFFESTVLDPSEPNCNSDWKEAPKFYKNCFNELWCDEGLAEYVSLCVYKERLPETIDPENFDKNYYSIVNTTIAKRLKKAWNCLCEFIRVCDDPSCFAGIGGEALSCGCVSTCRCGDINTFSWGIY